MRLDRYRKTEVSVRRRSSRGSFILCLFICLGVGVVCKATHVSRVGRRYFLTLHSPGVRVMLVLQTLIFGVVFPFVCPFEILHALVRR